jgi:hypothetical protein
MQLARFYMNWYRAQDGQCHAEYLPCSLYNLKFDRHDPISHLLDRELQNTGGGGQQEGIKENTSFTALLSLYRNHGYQLPLSEINTNTTRTGTEQKKKGKSHFHIKPIPRVPNLDYCSTYHILALEVDELGRFLRKYIHTQYCIEATLNHFCNHYKLDIEKTFPSLSHSISNYKPNLQGINVKRMRKNDEKEEMPFIYDNAALQIERPTKKHKGEERVRDIVSPKRRLSAASSSSVEEKEQEQHYGRLMPVSILPLFLDMLPLFYQSINNTVIQSQNLRDALLREIPLSHYPDYLYQQIEVLNMNCEYVSYIHQQAYYLVHCREESELEAIYNYELMDTKMMDTREDIVTLHSQIKKLSSLAESLLLKKKEEEEAEEAEINGVKRNT